MPDYPSRVGRYETTAIGGEAVRASATIAFRIEQLGRPAATAMRLHQFLQRRGLTTIPDASRQLGLSQPTVTSAIGRLRKLGTVRETTGRRRGKVFIYGGFLDLLSEGTDPLPR